MNTSLKRAGGAMVALALAAVLAPRPTGAQTQDQTFPVTISPSFVQPAGQFGTFNVFSSFDTPLGSSLLSTTGTISGVDPVTGGFFQQEFPLTFTDITQPGAEQQSFQITGQSPQDAFLLLAPGTFNLATTVTPTGGSPQTVNMPFQVQVPDIASVQQIVSRMGASDVGLIDRQQVGMLRATLRVAQQAIDRGQVNLACNLLNVFSNQVRVRSRGRHATIDPQAGAVLRADVQALCSQLLAQQGRGF